jgi:hypothetical protein
MTVSVSAALPVTGSVVTVAAVAIATMAVFAAAIATEATRIFMKFDLTSNLNTITNYLFKIYMASVMVICGGLMGPAVP